MRFEKILAAQVRAQLECFDDLFPIERVALHREMARRGREVTGKLLWTKYADNSAKSADDAETARRLFQQARSLYDELVADGACCSVAELAVSGNDVVSIGYNGKSIGNVLQKLLGEVAAETLPNRKIDLLKRAERLYRSGYGVERNRTAEK